MPVHFRGATVVELTRSSTLFEAVLQSPSESGITSRSFTVDSIVNIGGHSSP